MLTRQGALLALVDQNYNPKTTLSRDNADFLLFENGGTGYGLRMTYRETQVRHLFENYATPIDQWFHVAVQVKPDGSGNCLLSFYIDGVDLTMDKSTNALHPNARAMCGASGALRGFGGAGGQMQLRLGMGFGGEINEVMFYKSALPGVRSRMHRVKDVVALKPQLAAAYLFDEVDASSPAVVSDSTGQQAAGSLQNGAFRSIVYGVAHKWVQCPGTTRFSSETVCSTRSYWEQGVCVRRPGVDNYACECNEGFFGADCSGECPGGAGNICSNHGKCQVLNETICICEQGYVGNACQHECPGWTAPLNQPNRKLCFGFGKCQLKADKSGAECLCDQSFDRYGPSCQYTYGEKPVASIDDGCDDCRGSHRQCVDGACLCEKDYYLVVGVCKPSSAATHSASLMLVLLLAALIQ